MRDEFEGEEWRIYVRGGAEQRFFHDAAVLPPFMLQTGCSSAAQRSSLLCFPSGCSRTFCTCSSACSTAASDKLHGPHYKGLHSSHRSDVAHSMQAEMSINCHQRHSNTYSGGNEDLIFFWFALLKINGQSVILMVGSSIENHKKRIKNSL